VTFPWVFDHNLIPWVFGLTNLCPRYNFHALFSPVVIVCVEDFVLSNYIYISHPNILHKTDLVPTSQGEIPLLVLQSCSMPQNPDQPDSIDSGRLRGVIMFNYYKNIHTLYFY